MRLASSQDELRIEGDTHAQAKTEYAATQLKSAKNIPQQKHRRDHAERTKALGMLQTKLGIYIIQTVIYVTAKGQGHGTYLAQGRPRAPQHDAEQLKPACSRSKEAAVPNG